ncbi:MAG: ribonuclease P protein component [Patescibacteria group bacterium]|jgi:ribonuclease P protein component
MLKKEYRLRKKKDIDLVFKEGSKSFYNDFLGIKSLKNNKEYSRLVVIISAKVSKKSVNRNKMKRRVKYFFINNKKEIASGFDFVITVKKDFSQEKYSKIEIFLTQAFKEVV